MKFSPFQSGLAALAIALSSVVLAQMPSMPSMPSMPALPAIPAIPAVPAVPAIPAVLAALPAAAAAATGKTEVLWLGQAATRITTPGGKVIVIDPWLRTNPKTPQKYKELEALGKVDLILVTHGHFDHFADAPDLAKMHKVPMYGPAGMNSAVITLGILPTELAPRFGKGGTIMPFGPGGIKITATRAEHSSEINWKNPATSKDETHPGGEPVGFIIEMENGFKVWHMGDTGLFGDMKFIGEYYKPDLIMIPIGGHFVMSPADAAVATRDMIKPKFAIPIHYGTTPVLRGTTAEFATALGNTTIKMFPINPGDKLDF
jgi:L-ascorbate metabolism protein UlaG (beta-lactamase superfamily)